MARLAKEIPDLPIRNATQLADAAQNSDDLVAYGQALDGLCRTLIKQAADLRLLSSGPECGFMEIALPPRQPGSSAMPGKVNPVIPEFLMQCCFSVIGYISSCGLAAEHAELDLNVWEGIFLQSMCSSTDLLVPALNAFADYCLRDLTVNRENAARRANNRTSKIAEHAKRVSYSDALKDMESLATQVR
jgi:aspartate ammonia-lyase